MRMFFGGKRSRTEGREKKRAGTRLASTVVDDDEKRKTREFLWLYLFSNLTTIKYELLKVNSHLLCSHLIGQLVNDQCRQNISSPRNSEQDELFFPDKHG
jgi:hypothetical protein